jgi:CheY-like chemotaxis protein
LPERIETEISLLAGLWKIDVDAASLESALLNVILNARDAMPDGGRLTIETSNVRIDDDYIERRREDLRPGRHVLVAISDTGRGIAPEHLESVFEPFFTTKAIGEGTGLGLSMVQGFVKQSSGTVQIYSEPGVGTTVKLYFPTSKADLGGHRETEPHENVANSSGERILLAEDDPDVLAVLVEILSRSGFDVRATGSGDEALAAFLSDPTFDLLVTDIVMPGDLQGTALARRLRGIRPDLPVVFMSGYANEATVHGNGLRPEDIRLMKPVRTADILAAVRKALE